MDDWRPDWRDESLYPTNDDSYKRFAWEFLRRNENYSNDFQVCHGFRLKDLGEKKIALGDLKAISLAHVQSEMKSTFLGVLVKFNMQFLVSPDLDYTEAENHLAFGTFDAEQNFRPIQGIAILDYPFVNRFGSRVQALHPIEPSDVIVRFDLNRDLQSQIDEASSQLAQRQNNYTRPENPDKKRLRRLLSILDAKATTPATTHRIIGKHYGLDDSIANQSISRDLRHAKEFCNSGYINLVRLPSMVG